MELFLTHEGDLMVTDDDLQLVTGIAEILQGIAIRLKTTPGGFLYHTSLGCALDQLIGALLTPATLKEGERLLTVALNDSPLLLGVTLEVRGIPVSRAQALFIVAVNNLREGERLYLVPFDYEHGAVGYRDQSIIPAGADLTTAGIAPF